jgi:hypothetical protein
MAHKFPIDKLMVDATTTLLVLFCALFAIEAIQEKASKSAKDNAITGPEKVITVEAEWPNELDVDIDLWVKGPLDDEPVGYSRHNDKQTSYQRDDRGITGDLSSYNYEVASIRKPGAGIYVVNVHWFSNVAEAQMVPVKVRASLSAAGVGGFVIATSELAMTVKGTEQTAFTFELDNEGALIEGSVLHDYVPLRITP